MNEQQYLLLNKSKNSNEAAKVLLNETFFAFSVARSYYTMFYLAEIFLLENELNFSKHSAVISAFGKEFIKTQKVPLNLHKYLIKWSSIRNRADYDTATEITEEEAKLAIINAEEFIEFTEAFFSK